MKGQAKEQVNVQGKGQAKEQGKNVRAESGAKSGSGGRGKGKGKRKQNYKKYFSFLYLIIFGVLTFIFITNDFGLLDLRKTSVIIGVALDYEEEEVVLTAQLAIPQPAENGENTKFNVVTGRGQSVASALHEVNVKTGYYPKLDFCKLIILGETCFSQNIIKFLDYFYRNEYSGLRMSVASCEGKAGELISQEFPCGNSATDVIDKVLSQEAQSSANVCSVSLKDVGEKLWSKSKGVFMPYLQNGILVEEPSGGGDSGGSGGSGSSGHCEESELTCNCAAIFSDGNFKGILNEEQNFALALLNNEVKHTFLDSGNGGDKRVIGLRSCKGGVKVSIEEGTPVLKFQFSAKVKLQDSDKGFSPEELKNPGVSKQILSEGEDDINRLFISLYEFCKERECDILGIKNRLYKKSKAYFKQYEDSIFSSLTVTGDVKLKSFT